MPNHLAFVVFSILFLSIHGLPEDSSTVHVVEQTTAVSTPQHTTAQQTTGPLVTEIQTTSPMTTTKVQTTGPIVTEIQTTSPMATKIQTTGPIVTEIQTTEHTTVEQTSVSMVVDTHTTNHMTVEQTTSTKVMNDHTIEHMKMDATSALSIMHETTHVLGKPYRPSYVEPPPHPLGYCIRSRLRCSKIRRCCSGPCNVMKMKCP